MMWQHQFFMTFTDVDGQQTSWMRQAKVFKERKGPGLRWIVTSEEEREDHPLSIFGTQLGMDFYFQAPAEIRPNYLFFPANYPKTHFILV